MDPRSRAEARTPRARRWPRRGPRRAQGAAAPASAIAWPGRAIRTRGESPRDRPEQCALRWLYHSPREMAAIGFLRPRLGIGGSERLVLDAATQLQRRGCSVRFHIPDAAAVPEFPEVSTGAVAVERVASHWPEHILGRMRAPMAIMRTATAARAMARGPLPDLVFCDVVSHVVPLV